MSATPSVNARALRIPVEIANGLGPLDHHALRCRQDERLLGHEAAEALVAEDLVEGLDLARVLLDRRDLLVEELPLDVVIEIDLVVRHDVGRAGPEDVERRELLEPLLRVTLREDGVEQVGSGFRDRVERFAGPTGHVLVGDVARHPLGPEREDGVRIDVLHDPPHLLGTGRIEPRVHVDVDRALEEVMLLHPEDVQAPEQLVRADLAHRLGRPSLLVHRPALAARGGDVHHSLAASDGGGHQPGGQVDVVVRMRPDTEDRSEVGDVDHADGC